MTDTTCILSVNGLESLALNIPGIVALVWSYYHRKNYKNTEKSLIKR